MKKAAKFFLHENAPNLKLSEIPSRVDCGLLRMSYETLFPNFSLAYAKDLIQCRGP